MLDNCLFLNRSECFYNSRTKCFVSPSGDLIPYEMMISNRQVFSDGGNELTDFSKEVGYQLAYREAAEEIFNHGFGKSENYKSAPMSKAELLDASRRRARRKVFDYCICNDFDIFITLTLDSELIERDNYQVVIKKLNTFLDNRVRRKGLKYIGVPELHKKGGLHFHFAATSNAFKLVDSGTVSCEGYKKPMKLSTAKRKGIPQEKMHTVYNIADWKLGYSTAIFTYGDRGAVAHYLSKELCKDVQKNVCKENLIDKIGGRWYYHGGDLKRPVCIYDNKNFKEYENFSYMLNTDGGNFKVYKFRDNGEILK